MSGSPRLIISTWTSPDSLGATLYELLTLEPPHTGQSREQVLAQIVHKEPKAPRRIQKKVPVDLETICLKCLEKDPDRRYQKAGQLAEDLRRYVNRFAISARRVGPVGQLVKWMRRRPAVAAALACVLLAAGIAAFFAVQAYRTEQQRRVEQARAQEDLQGVQRDRALENAIAAAMGGDMDKAEKAISKAEAHGASTGQVRMLRGQVAFYQGDFELALVDLEQAVKLDPESVAARGMLAQAYSFLDLQRYEQTVTELEALSPRTPEDYLFKGYAESGLDPAQALQTLNEAVKRSRSPLARAIRADVRTALAEDKGDQEEAERALADVQAANEYLADNPYVLSVSVMAHVVAANLYLEAGKLERQQAALKEAERDARALEPWDTFYPSLARWVYFEQTGHEAASFAVARRASEKRLAYNYALGLYRRDQFAEALLVLDRATRKSLAEDYLRACILAELYPQDRSFARAAYEQMARRYWSGQAALATQQILLLLGYKDDAIAASRALRRQGSGRPPLSQDFGDRLLGYYCGELSDSELLKGTDRSRGSRCFAHHAIALTRLAEGDRPGAREHFRQAVKTPLMFELECHSSRSFLTRMEKDPTWPPWIPLKNDKTKP